MEEIRKKLEEARRIILEKSNDFTDDERETLLSFTEQTEAIFDLVQPIVFSDGDDKYHLNL